MRKSFVFKSVLLSVLVNGAVVASAHASNLAYEISRISDACEKGGPKSGNAAEAQRGSPLSVGVVIGVPASASENSAGANTRQQLNNLVESAANMTASVNSSACDGLMAQLAQGKFLADSDTQTKVMGTASEAFTNQPIAVSLPAAAWLFSSALFGFVMVANRRKV
ncbi:hypothetical protein QIW53_00940 [Pseudomonas fluorescens]|uniref:hypothetical protein n=1 Tax=Pseudomonas fluorescens TaxID=294 RepID=UPI003524D028